MKIYKDGKEITTAEKELEEILRVKIRAEKELEEILRVKIRAEILRVKKRAENTYNNTIHIISTSRDETERQAARMIMFAVGRILGYSDEEIEQDIKEAYGVE